MMLPLAARAQRRARAALVTNNELRIPKGREFPPQPVPGSESDLLFFMTLLDSHTLNGSSPANINTYTPTGLSKFFFSSTEFRKVLAYSSAFFFFLGCD